MIFIAYCWFPWQWHSAGPSDVFLFFPRSSREVSRSYTCIDRISSRRRNENVFFCSDYLQYVMLFVLLQGGLAWRQKDNERLPWFVSPRHRLLAPFTVADRWFSWNDRGEMADFLFHHCGVPLHFSVKIPEKIDGCPAVEIHKDRCGALVDVNRNINDAQYRLLVASSNNATVTSLGIFVRFREIVRRLLYDKWLTWSFVDELLKKMRTVPRSNETSWCEHGFWWANDRRLSPVNRRKQSNVFKMGIDERAIELYHGSVNIL